MPPTLHTRAASTEQTVDTGNPAEPQRSMSVQDMIYGQIELPPVIRLLTDSPIVQRLRDLKQLGNSYYVYPSATHSRFEHSLGVCYLAMDLYRNIVDSHRGDHRNFQVPQVARMSHDTVQKTMHCIGIAGLCHDLGHGPLSHMFESFVRSSAAETEPLRTWSHEEASILLLRSLWAEKNAGLTELGFTVEDLRYVELLINGLRPGKPWPTNVGRDSWNRFTTEIVANKRNGLDVDKIDYIQRDSVACLGTATFVSMRRLFQGARVVVNKEGETSIGYPDKLDGVIEEIFLARAHLHRIVYQHRVTKIVDLMTLDALRAAGRVFMVANSKGVQLPLSACPLHPEFYVHASDWIVMAILHSNGAPLAHAREILQRVQSRNLYTTIGSYRYNEKTLVAAARSRSVPGSSQQMKHTVMLDELNREVEAIAPKLMGKLREWSEAHDRLQTIEILQAEITQSAGDMNKMVNPVDATYFFNARQSANYPVEPHATCNATTTMSSQQGPVSSIVVVCRMPLTPEEKELLRSSFTCAADRLGNADTNSFSCSPPASQRGRDSTMGSQRESTLQNDAEPPQASIGEWMRSPAVKRLKLERDGSLPGIPPPLNGVSSSSLELMEDRAATDECEDEKDMF